MKTRKIFLLTALSAALLSSCSNNIPILAPYKDVTVVYGLLDQNDTTHYIRINKAYEGLGNAYTMAKVYDSINYPAGTLNVTLQENDNGNILNTFTLSSTTAIPLDPGIFSYPNQILYYFKSTNLPVMDASGNFIQYQLVITNEKTGKTITGSTPLLQDLAFSNFPQRYLSISFYPLFPSNISFSSTQYGRLYQMTFRFYYTEITQQGGTSIKSIDWIFAPQTAPGLSGGYPISYNYTAQGFFQLLHSSLAANPTINRTADSFHVIFTTGSDDLNTYIQLSQPPTGIDQDVPSFSDVKNGIGIFTARHTQTFSTLVSPALADSLSSDPLTAPFNFQVPP